MKKLFTAITIATMIMGSATPIVAKQPINRIELNTKNKMILNKDGKVSDLVYQYDAENSILYFGFSVKNPNTKQMLEFPHIKVTARSDNGTILASSDAYLFWIWGKDKVYFGSQTNCSEEPKIVNATYQGDQGKTNGPKLKTDDLFQITNLSDQSDEYSTKITGEIENKSNKKTSFALSTVYRQNGKIVAIYSDFLTTDVASMSKEPFEIITNARPEMIPAHDSLEVHAMPWS